ncbi:Rid family hydrolase [Falsigemmobacter faecalis]|uniref:RidA family protein n=1 Tax=Falsigemmobacter faecalis TaxID=2488730 RepID=A0A3P3DV77_9RHOB|nr:Rid family hydrolase [Falsigemmobacter faecalis]RRH78140.1 RidA family protein [Falsigemmobacter faecalis]
MENRIRTGSHYEELMGYSRAALGAGQIFVSGCSGLPAEGAPGTGPEQFARAVTKVEGILAKAGASLKDVVRTRIYLTDETEWDALAEAHGKAFGGIYPAASMIQVVRLIDTRMKIELEVTAVVAGA